MTNEQNNDTYQQYADLYHKNREQMKQIIQRIKQREQRLTRVGDAIERITLDEKKNEE